MLSKPKFSLVEKIKTIGSSYMVAAGLTPGVEVTDKLHVITLFLSLSLSSLISHFRSPGSSTSL